jgi:hypothetical protein
MNRRRDALTQAVARLLGEGLGGRVLPFDRGCLQLWRTRRAKRRTIDGPVATASVQVAVIAKARGARLVATPNVGGFDGCGVKCADP